MVVQPERRCVPLEVEMVSLHREPHLPRRSERVRRHRPFRQWIATVVRVATRRPRS